MCGEALWVRRESTPRPSITAKAHRVGVAAVSATHTTYRPHRECKPGAGDRRTATGRASGDAGRPGTLEQSARFMYESRVVIDERLDRDEPHEDPHDPGPDRPGQHGPARVPARLRLEPGPGPRPDA